MQYDRTPSTMASLVLYLGFVVLFCRTSVVLCSDKCIAICEECQPPPLTTDCTGGRQRLDGCGCCTVCAGQVNDYCDDFMSPCDEEFGLNCEINVCKGSFNVHVETETQGSLTIKWDPLLTPEHFQPFRCVLFFTEEYSDIIGDWSAREVGDSFNFVLEDVREGVDYFIRIVAMPIDGGFDDALVFTETLVYRTSSRDSWCHFNATHYSHGEELHNGCQVCTCHTGEWSCRAKHCPPPDDLTIINPVNCRHVPHPSEPECCQIRVCEENSTSDSQRSCWHDEIEHRHGDLYDHGCNETCYCDDGVEKCVPRCDDPGQLVPNPSTCPNPTLLPPPEGECCEMLVCLPPAGSCEFNGNVYEDGERFDVDCIMRCHCQGGDVGCVSLCPPTLMTPSLECPSPRLVDVPDECCQQWQCGPPVNIKCELEGVEVSEGDWIDVNCEHRCQCQYGALRCLPLCPVLVPMSQMPSLTICPEPFIGKRNEDDCCTEFFCHHPDRESPNEVQDVLSESSGPSSLVVSFFPPSNTEILAVIDSYEVYYTSQVNVSDISQWQLKRVQATTKIPTENSRGRRSVNHESRITVEVTGLTPNTVYFIKIRVSIGITPTHYVILPEYLPYSDTVVLKTANSTGGPCHFRDKILEDGEDMQDGCVQSCRCDLGVLVCKPLCQIYTLLPSAECPVPKLITIEGRCCREWRCFANEGDCRRNNRTYLHGEEWREGCDQRCFCSMGVVTCQYLCPDTESAPSDCPQATLIPMPDTCCKQWVCHPGVTPRPRPMPPILPPFSLLSINITTFDVTVTIAVIRWSPLTDLQRKYVTGLVVKHKDLLTANQWRQSEELHPSTRNFTLIGLKAGRTYLAQIVVIIEKSMLSVHLDSNIVTIHTKNKGSPSTMPFLIPVEIKISAVTDSSLRVTWTSLPPDIVNHLRSLHLVYNDTDQWSGSLGKIQVQYGVNNTEIFDLKSEHKYTVLLLGIWGNGTVLREIKSNVETATTKRLTGPHPSTNNNKYIIIGVCVVVAFVIASLACLLFIYIKRRDQREANYDVDSAVAFENKIYDTEDGEVRTRIPLSTITVVISHIQAGLASRTPGIGHDDRIIVKLCS
ncbi:uncharacterized protein [Ptychodera flava]|uniref:uncharacterized protein isoform X2 n=1 Tax=Ptychodera flava TaxID=63121 RepID=UPI00396A436D